MNRENTTADDIAGVIGFTATATLLSWFGRCNLYVPQQASEHHALGRLIGFSAFRRLCQSFGGGYLSLPSGARDVNDARDRELAQMFGDGLTVEQVSARTGISVRRAQQLRREIEASGLIPLVMENKKPIEARRRAAR